MLFEYLVYYYNCEYSKLKENLYLWKFYFKVGKIYIELR
jgi:hypothetical protein